MDFRYDSLEAGEIRLLKISQASVIDNKSNERQGEIFLYSLIHVDLDEEPTYSALSYTWGTLEATETIQIDGKDFAVRPNLLSALAKLERLMIGTGNTEHCFWIDAICINQGKSSVALAERSLQIVLMPQIYGNANAVFAWLGEPADARRNRLAFAKMKQLARKNAVTRGQFSRSTTAPPDHLEQVFDFLETTQAVGDTDQSDGQRQTENLGSGSLAERGNRSRCRTISALELDAWVGILELWQKPYWSRTWVVPEATTNESVTRVAPGRTTLHEKTFFLCGQESTGWESIEAAYFETWMHVWEPIFDESQQMYLSLLAEFERSLHLPVSTLLFFRKMRSENDPGWSQLELLERARHTSCQDPHDKVWAILPMIHPVRAVELPDYEKISVLDLYIRTVEFQLNDTGKELDFLGHIGPLKTWEPSSVTSRMPSWVPDWSKKIDVTPIPKVVFNALDSEHPRIHNPKDETAIFNASGGRSCTAYISGSSLHVESIFVDSICDLAVSDPAAGESEGQISGWLAYLEEKHEGFDVEDYLTSIVKIREMDLIYGINYRPLRRYDASTDVLENASVHDDNNTAKAWNLMNGYSPLMTGRQLCLTSKGYIGVVPVSALVGDIIVVIVGGRVLYTIRPTTPLASERVPDAEHTSTAEYGSDSDELWTDKFEYIGESYVHGLMDGIVMEWDDIEIEKIAIV